MTRAPGRPPRLSPQIVLDAAMSRAEHRTDPLSLAQIGRELGADPTAMYRHYRNKDELLRQMADRVYGEALAAVEPDIWDRPWREALDEVMQRTRRTYLKYPALALEMAPRFTGGVNERRHTQAAQRLLVRAGLPPVMAARHVRALAETTLGFVTISARLMTLTDELQLVDAEIGRATYPALPASARRLGVSEALHEEEGIFRLALNTHLDGIAAALHDPTHQEMA